MSKSRAKLFIENFMAYGAINALNKVVPLLMLPIITRLLTDTAEFGKFDMYITIMSLGSSLAVLGMNDAMFREYFEKDDKDYRQRVTSLSLIIVLISSLILSIILIFFNHSLSQFFLGDIQSGSIVVMASIGLLIAAISKIISTPTRIQNKRTVYVVSGLLYSITYYILAITLVYFGFGYKGMIYGNLVSASIILIFFITLNRKFFNLKVFDKKIIKELFKIGLPLMPTFIIYWVFNSMDKIMIANMLNLAQVGIYSVGAKVASISLFIYTAFSGGWQYFAYSTMKDKDQVGLTSKILEYLGIISFFAFFIAIFFDDFIFRIIFTGDYVLGSSVFPYLFLSPLLLMLFQTAGNQFLIAKKSYLITVSLIIGVLTNVTLNYIFINTYGIKGASLATLIGYSISAIIMIIMVKRVKLIEISTRFILVSMATAATVIIIFLFDNINSNIFSFLGIVLIFILYTRDIKTIITSLIRRNDN
ncbi:polysaccharide biosynthesis protein [Lottiidibacillus patelloidae]|uniref:Polysaccharide biosynthesis protein n=1 Tax=Lottiidibacillus patelloidae TaxID=2670334 RepID=A0A263BSS3_9BACI|nr:oligosaccharide flippase family protein [Lottiidibacillus patelloidae]OZM56417.1 polysaccharide biosynthesis protein [Lottiidibacillus patelloidae]